MLGVGNNTLLVPPSAAQRALQSPSYPLALWTVSEGSPHVKFVNLHFQGSIDAPALIVTGGGHVTIEKCWFSSNSGSALVVRSDGAVSIKSCIFTRNGRAETRSGGAIHADGGSVHVMDSTFVGNIAMHGGAIYADRGATLTVENSEFRMNRAMQAGGVRNPATHIPSRPNCVLCVGYWMT